MITRENLEELGFAVIDLFAEADINMSKIIYEFSDFEVFEARVTYKVDVNGKDVFVMCNPQLYNPFVKDELNVPEVYMAINYDLYFRKLDEFKQFFTSIGYRLPEVNVKNI